MRYDDEHAPPNLERAPRSVRALLDAVASIVLGRQLEVYTAEPVPEVQNAPPETLHHDDFQPLARFVPGKARPVHPSVALPGPDPTAGGRRVHGHGPGTPLPPLLDDGGRRICRTCRGLLPPHAGGPGKGRPRNHCERCHPPKTAAA